MIIRSCSLASSPIYGHPVVRWWVGLSPRSSMNTQACWGGEAAMPIGLPLAPIRTTWISGAPRHVGPVPHYPGSIISAPSFVDSLLAYFPPLERVAFFDPLPAATTPPLSSSLLIPTLQMEEKRRMFLPWGGGIGTRLGWELGTERDWSMRESEKKGRKKSFGWWGAIQVIHAISKYSSSQSNLHSFSANPIHVGSYNCSYHGKERHVSKWALCKGHCS